MAIVPTVLVDVIGAQDIIESGSVSPAAGGMLIAVSYNNTTGGAAVNTIGGTLTGTWTAVGGLGPTTNTKTTFYTCTDYGASGTISADVAVSTDVAVLYVLHIAGSANAVAQWKSARGTGSTATVTMDATPASGAATFGFCTNVSNDNWTAGSGYTTMGLLGDQVQGAKHFAEYDLTGTDTATAAATTSTWSIIAAEIRLPAVSAGGFEQFAGAGRWKT